MQAHADTRAQICGRVRTRLAKHSRPNASPNTCGYGNEIYAETDTKHTDRPASPLLPTAERVENLTKGVIQHQGKCQVSY